MDPNDWMCGQNLSVKGMNFELVNPHGLHMVLTFSNIHEGICDGARPQPLIVLQQKRRSLIHVQVN